MTKKELIEALTEFSDDKRVLIFDGEGLKETDFVAENLNEGKSDDGAAVIYIEEL